jgi:hypothetical protein
MGLKLMETLNSLIMEASFHKRDKQILNRLVVVFGRVPNRMNIRLPELISPGFAVCPLSQREESEMPRGFDDCGLIYLAKRMNGSIDRQTTSQKEQTRIGNQ